MPPWLMTAAGAIASSVFGYIGAQQQRKQAIKDQDNQYVRMRNAAQRAGFNPLTVLRLTGGQGFTGLPTISKAAAFGNAALGVFDAFKNAPIEKYQEKVRDLTLKDMKARIDNTLVNTAYTGILASNASKIVEDEYKGFDDKIPVKYGFKTFSVPTEIAKRLDIKPYDRVTAGDIAELMGEGSEVVVAFTSAAQKEQYDATILDMAGGDEVIPPVLSKEELEAELKLARPMNRAGVIKVEKLPALSTLNFGGGMRLAK